MRSTLLVAALTLAAAVLAAACEGDNELPPPTPTATPDVVATVPPTATLEPTSVETPEATPTPTVTPTQTATPTTTPTPTSTGTVEPTPTVTPTPQPTPAPTPAPKPTPPPSECPEPSTTLAVRPVSSAVPEPPPGGWQPAIQEIETDHEALGRVFFERDDEMELELCNAFGLFFLDVETGGVEGWTWDAQLLPSPGNRFVYFPSEETPVLYDRLTGRSYTWDASEMSLAHELAETHWRGGAYTSALLGWGTGPAEHLVFRSGTRYAVVDASLEAIAWFQLPGNVTPETWWAHPDGTHLLARAPSEDSLESLLYSIDLSDGSRAVVRIPPRQGSDGSYHQVGVSPSTIAVRSRTGRSNEIKLERYDWSLRVVSSVSVPHGGFGTALSPDGTLLAAVKLFRAEAVPHGLGTTRGLSITSILDATTGEELIRVKGALPSSDTFAIHFGRSRWLADSSALVLDASTDTRVVGIDGAVIAAFPTHDDWWQGLVIPSRDDPARFDRPFGLSLGYCNEGDRAKGAGIKCRVLRARISDSAGDDISSARLVLHLVPGSQWLAGEWAWSPVYDRTSWGLTSDELRLHLVPGGPWEGGSALPALKPLVEYPYFGHLTALEVDTNEGCVLLREVPDNEAEDLGCLPSGTVVDSRAPPKGATFGDSDSPAGYIAAGFAHVVTEDGVEGWLPLDSLKWAE